MDKKILILLMSCNKPLYGEEELACRETFLTDAEGAGMEYWFYKGLDEAHSGTCVDVESHTLWIEVNDGLAGTAKKTLGALRWSLTRDYDYLIKTNVSTYLNIKNILSATKGWAGKEDPNIYGASFIVNEYSLNVPFPRGNFVMLPRPLVETVVNVGPLMVGKPSMPVTDDTLTCLALLYGTHREDGPSYMERLKEVPAVTEWFEAIESQPEFSQALSVRCKDERRPERTPAHIRETHVRYKAPAKYPTESRRPINLIETGFGFLKYGSYCEYMDRIKKKREKEKTPDR